MSELLQFSESFWGWMNILVKPEYPEGFSRPPAQPHLAFSTDGGGVGFLIESLPDGWVRVGRLDRSLDPWFLYDFASMEGAEAYLCVQYSSRVRDKLGLVHKTPNDYFYPRDRVGMESGRFETRVIAMQGPMSTMWVFSSGGKDYFRGSYPTRDFTPSPGDWDPIVALTWYADKPLDEVLASLRNPSGAPLFELLGDRRA